jgi:hypothetical protein
MPVDFKRKLKSPNSVRDICSTIVSHYQIAVDSKLVPNLFWRVEEIQERKVDVPYSSSITPNCSRAPRSPINGTNPPLITGLFRWKGSR